MKYLYFLVFGVLLAVTCSCGAKPGKHLFILAGQSNMKWLNPDLSFTPAVIKEFGKDNIIVVKDAKDGQPIRRWYKKWKSAKGETLEKKYVLYDSLIQKVSEAVKEQKIKTVTFVWMQGEMDASQGHGEVYAASLLGIVEQLSKDLGRADINLVIGRISDFALDNKGHPHWTMVRKAQVSVANTYSRGAWVDTDDLNDGKVKRGKLLINDLHYSNKGYEVLGKRFAARAIELIKKHPADSGAWFGCLGRN